MRKCQFNVTANKAFPEVINACAEAPRSETWISHEFEATTNELHEKGYAHSVEVWDEERLIGGLFGLGFNGVFSGLSMFYIESNASKLALIALMQHLHKRGYAFCDAQFHSEHLEQFGCSKLDSPEYERRLKDATMMVDVSFADDMSPFELNPVPVRDLKLLP